MSLILKKEEGPGNNTIVTELAQINRYHEDLLTSDNHTNAIRKGQIDDTNGSYLSLQWNYPSLLESGRYVCEGYIMNSQAEVHYQSARATVGSSAPELGQVVDRIQEIETNLNLIVSNIATLANLQSTMIQQISKLQSVQNDWKNALFSSPPLYVDENGPRHYYLSRFQPQDVINAEAACIALGGYLAEVDTELEYDYIINFVNASLQGNINILLGGTQNSNGEWVTRKNETLGYTHWYSPTGSDQCQAVSALHLQTYMEKIPCFNINTQNLYFLCEVENF